MTVELSIYKRPCNDINIAPHLCATQPLAEISFSSMRIPDTPRCSADPGKVERGAVHMWFGGEQRASRSWWQRHPLDSIPNFLTWPTSSSPPTYTNKVVGVHLRSCIGDEAAYLEVSRKIFLFTSHRPSDYPPPPPLQSPPNSGQQNGRRW